MTDLQASDLRRILSVGFGVTGRAVAAYCVRHRIDLFVSSSGALAAEERDWLRRHRVPFEEGGHSRAGLERADAVVLSPGVRMDSPLVRMAGDSGIPVLSELDLASVVAPKWPVIAVTGTNGKGSTVTLAGVILRGAGVGAVVCGNIGTPWIDVADRADGPDAYVVEASSFQLEQSSLFHADVAVLTTFTPDHIERHGSMKAYRAAKARLFAHQGQGDVAVLPAGLAALFPEGAGRRIPYSPEVMAAHTTGWRTHERANLAAAATACQSLVPELSVPDLDFPALREALAEPFRMEEIGCIGGVRVINDSKSTNAGSAVAALRAIDERVVVLIGGRSKQLGYEALARELGSRSVRGIVLFGAAGPEIEPLFAAAHPTVIRTTTLEEAVRIGLSLARSGDALLFSPACSSFDQFADYADRGRAFTRLIAAQPGFHALQRRAV